METAKISAKISVTRCTAREIPGIANNPDYIYRENLSSFPYPNNGYEMGKNRLFCSIIRAFQTIKPRKNSGFNSIRIPIPTSNSSNRWVWIRPARHWR